MSSPLPLALYGFGLSELLIILLLLSGLALWVWMIVDCATKEEETGSKIAWLLVILILVLWERLSIFSRVNFREKVSLPVRRLFEPTPNFMPCHGFSRTATSCCSD